VPHCDTCERFYNPNSLRPDGTCPTCGHRFGHPETVMTASARAPWHFKVLIAITVIYLSWRLIQGIFWLAHQL